MVDAAPGDIEWWDFEPLSGVFELRSQGMLTAVALQFGPRYVQFEAIAEDDTLSVREIPRAPESHSEHDVRAVSDKSPWARFVGESVRWGRTLTNHHGYLDGYHLEFSLGSEAIGDGIEMVVAASSIVLGTTRFGL